MNNQDVTFFVIDNHPNNHNIGNYEFVYYSEKAKRIASGYRFRGEACFASLKCREIPPGLCESFIYYIRKGSAHKGDYGKISKRYMRWVIQSSPWQWAFKDKRYTVCHAEGYAHLRTDLPANYVVAAATAIRYIIEYPQIVVTWDLLVKRGFDKREALILAHFMDIYKTQRGYAFNSCARGEGHTVINGYQFKVNHYNGFVSPQSLEDISKNWTDFKPFSECRLYSKNLGINSLWVNRDEQEKDNNINGVHHYRWAGKKIKCKSVKVGFGHVEVFKFTKHNMEVIRSVIETIKNGEILR